MNKPRLTQGCTVACPLSNSRISNGHSCSTVNDVLVGLRCGPAFVAASAEPKGVSVGDLLGGIKCSVVQKTSNTPQDFFTSHGRKTACASLFQRSFISSSVAFFSVTPRDAAASTTHIVASHCHPQFYVRGRSRSTARLVLRYHHRLLHIR